MASSRAHYGSLFLRESLLSPREEEQSGCSLPPVWGKYLHTDTPVRLGEQRGTRSIWAGRHLGGPHHCLRCQLWENSLAGPDSGCQWSKQRKAFQIQRWKDKHICGSGDPEAQPAKAMVAMVQTLEWAPGRACLGSNGFDRIKKQLYRLWLRCRK